MSRLLRFVGAVGLAAAVAAVKSAAAAAAADVPTIVIHIQDHPLPQQLDLQGKAVAPDSLLLECSADSRRKIQPDLDAVTALIARAGGDRVQRASFSAGQPIKTPDGLVFSLVATPNHSYIVAVDSTQTQVTTQTYFSECVKMASGTMSTLKKLGLPLPKLNLSTAQYSPAVGFYMYMNYH